MVYSALDCTTDDYHALFVLCLLYAVSHSKGFIYRTYCPVLNLFLIQFCPILFTAPPNLSLGINSDLLERLQLPVPDQERSSYSLVLAERLIRVMSQAAQPGNVHVAVLAHVTCFLSERGLAVHLCAASVLRWSSSSRDSGAQLPFVKAVRVVWKSVHHQRCSSGLPGGMTHEMFLSRCNISMCIIRSGLK